MQLFFLAEKLLDMWSEVAQLCPTLCDPIDCSLPGSSVHGIFQAIVLEWVAIFFSRGSSQPRARTWVSRIVDRRFTVWATREVQCEHWSSITAGLALKWSFIPQGWLSSQSKLGERGQLDVLPQGKMGSSSLKSFTFKYIQIFKYIQVLSEFLKTVMWREKSPGAHVNIQIFIPKSGVGLEFWTFIKLPGMLLLYFSKPHNAEKTPRVFSERLRKQRSPRLGAPRTSAAAVCLATQSCMTVCFPMDCSLPGSSIHGILQASILLWVAVSFSRASSRPKDRTYVFWVSCIDRWILSTEPPSKSS